MAVLDDLIAKFQQQQEAAREANERRYQEGLAIYDRIIKQYEPGGAFLQGVEKQLGREKAKTVAQQTQDLISSGLFGTSLTAGLGKKFEEEVATPARLRAQDIAFERLAQAGVGKAGFIERREDVGPDYGLIAQLAMAAASRPTGGGAYYPTTRRDDWELPGFTEPWMSSKSPFTGRRPTRPSQPTTSRDSARASGLLPGEVKLGPGQGRGTMMPAGVVAKKINGKWRYFKKSEVEKGLVPGTPEFVGPPAPPTYSATSRLAMGQGPISQQYARQLQENLFRSINPYYSAF